MHHMNPATKPQIAAGKREMRRQVGQRHLRPHHQLVAGMAGRPVGGDITPSRAVAAIGRDQPVTLVAVAIAGDKGHARFGLVNVGDVDSAAVQPADRVHSVADHLAQGAAFKAGIGLMKGKADQGAAAVEGAHGDVMKTV